MSLTFPELLKRESPGEHISDSQPSRLTDLITHWWTLKAKQTKAQIFSKVSELWWTCCCCIVQSHWTTQVLPCKQTWTTGDTLTVWVGVKRGAGGVLPVSMHKAANWAANEPDKIIRLVFIRSLLSGKPFIRSSEVLFFFSGGNEKPPAAHSHSAVINPEIPQPFMALLWFLHHSNTSFSMLIRFTVPLLWNNNTPTEPRLKKKPQEILCSPVIEIIGAEFEDNTWSWTEASVSSDAIKSSSAFRATGVHDLCLHSGKALQHEMMGLHAKWGINT